VVVVVVMLFGELFRMPQWLQDLSPFEHLALVPATDVDWAPFVGLTVVALLLTAAAHVGFDHRDLG
jgi:ABC-2 type transport system permease protein